MNIQEGQRPLTAFSQLTEDVDSIVKPFVSSTDAYADLTEKGSELRVNIESEIENSGSVVLYWQPYSDSVIVSRSTAIVSPSDLEGLKIGSEFEMSVAISETIGELAENINLSRTEMAASEVILSRSTESNLLKNADKVKSVTFANHSPFVNLIAVPSDQWVAIDESYREIILEAASLAEMQAIDGVERAVSGLINFAHGQGIEARVLTVDENSAWTDAVK